MNDKLVRATGANGAIRLVAALTTETSKEASRRHSLSFLTTVLLGRAMGAGLLLASSMKVKQGRVSIRFQSDGPLRGLLVDAGRDGTVRGYVGNPKLELDLTKNKQGDSYFDFKTATGKGYLHVTRDIGKGEPFTSTVELSGGCVGEDVATYLLHSEQIHSAIFVGETIRNSQLICSGALMVQVFPQPDGTDSHIDVLNKECSLISNFSSILYNHKDDIELLFANLFPSLKTELIDSPANFQNIKFDCKCSRERSINALKLLAKEELKDILENDKKSELTCQFCNSVYIINEDEIRNLLTEKY